MKTLPILCSILIAFGLAVDQRAPLFLESARTRRWPTDVLRGGFLSSSVVTQTLAPEDCLSSSERSSAVVSVKFQQKERVGGSEERMIYW